MGHQVVIDLPDWLSDWPARPSVLPGRDERMRFAIELARRNVEHGTGGPFGAVVVEAASGRVLGLGVNRVMPLGNSCAHAEVVALVMAEHAVGTFDLSTGGAAAELVTSVEPCVMCIGAVLWSGVRSLVCGAREEDAVVIGFDEGPKAVDWVGELGARGITVVQDVLRSEAAAVLADYAAGGGHIYNAGRG